MRKHVLAALLLVLAAPAGASDIPKLDIRDFALDWKAYAGKVVIIYGGKLSIYGTDSGSLRSTEAIGISAYLKPPWKNKGELRWAIKTCSNFSDDTACEVIVGATVGTQEYIGMPVLTGIVVAPAR
jgi:hypothetical protein